MHRVARTGGLVVPSVPVRRVGLAAGAAVVVVVVVAGLAAVAATLGLGLGPGSVFGSGGSAAVEVARPFPRAGVRVPVPEGWGDRAEGAPSVVVELEERALGGLVAPRGLWVSRWTSHDPEALVAGWSSLGGPFGPADDSTVGGLPARHRVERLGPNVTDRLPTVLTRRRSIHRLVAFGHVYEVGFWGPASTVGDDVERRVLAALRFHEPPPLQLDAAGWAVDVPGRWDEGRGCGFAERCASAPGGGGQPSPAWVYLFDRGSPDATLEEAAAELAEALRRDRAVDLTTEPTALPDGRPAVRLRFGHREDDGSVSSVEELVVERPDGSGFTVLALGWRTDAGRAALDSVLATLRPYAPAP